jgi:solute carrier family 25 (mitochondrial phosphate transporter), member 3
LYIKDKMTTPYEHHGYNHTSGFNLAKHPTCDAVRRERKRLLQLQAQQTSLASSPQHDAQYYISCYFAGGLSSSIRWVLSPLELIKTRLQTSSAVASTILSPNYVSSTAIIAPTIKNNTMTSTFVSIYAQEGMTGLFRGVGPTAVAYWLQTSTKYSLYETIKDQLSSKTSEKVENNTLSSWNRGLIYVTAAASAEAIADIFMCPFEMLKVKMQTSVAGKSKSLFQSASTSFPNEFVPALREMIVNRKKYNFPFGSLGPVWGRQIPGTIVNFFTFENAVSIIYASMGNFSKSDYTPTQQLGVTVLAGYIAGVCCAVVSHPADSIISLKSLPEHQGHSIVQIIHRVGWYRLATKGLLPRILMTGQIIAFQWLLYDSFKSMLGYSTSGGSK